MAELDDIGISRPAEIMLAIVLNVCRVLSVIPFVIFLVIWIPIAMSPWLIVGPWRMIGRTRLQRDLNG